MRKSQRRQRNGKLHGRPHRYAAHRKRDNKHEGETAAEFNRLEIALEIGLEDLSRRQMPLLLFSRAP